jgi:hypothetical protein
MRFTTTLLGLSALVIASTTAAVAAPANATRIPGADADEFKIAAASQVCCEVGEEDDWSPTAQACTAQQGKVVANTVCTAPDEADDGGPDDGVEDDDGGPDDGVDDGGPDDGKDDGTDD